ncbi:hypothetical protein MMC29_005678 [Sticta canariensis]|nr:hypothetical protein [Sticta canariensis]
MVKIYRDGFSVVWTGAESPPVVNIIFIHGLRGHPRETWENPAAHSQNDDGGTATAKKNHGFRAFFGTKRKQREAPHDKASTRAQETIFWIQDFLPQDIPDARILTYGFNADVIGGLFVANNKNSISQHGRDLKAKLERDLDNEDSSSAI